VRFPILSLARACARILALRCASELQRQNASGAYHRRVGAVMVHGASSGLAISVLPVCMEGSCSGRVAARRSSAARVTPPPNPFRLRSESPIAAARFDSRTKTNSSCKAGAKAHPGRALAARLESCPDTEPSVDGPITQTQYPSVRWPRDETNPHVCLYAVCTSSWRLETGDS
jgi:hypothetical protein